MAIVQITVNDVLERFPDFEGQEATIAALIPEVYLYVTDTWIEATQRPAALYLMAHLLTMEQQQSDGASGVGDIASESIGPMSVSYSQNPRSSSGLDLKATEWGRRFLALGRGQFGGPVVI